MFHKSNTDDSHSNAVKLPYYKSIVDDAFNSEQYKKDKVVIIIVSREHLCHAEPIISYLAEKIKLHKNIRILNLHHDFNIYEGNDNFFISDFGILKKFIRSINDSPFLISFDTDLAVDIVNLGINFISCTERRTLLLHYIDYGSGYEYMINSNEKYISNSNLYYTNYRKFLEEAAKYLKSKYLSKDGLTECISKESKELVDYIPTRFDPKRPIVYRKHSCNFNVAEHAWQFIFDMDLSKLNTKLLCILIFKIDRYCTTLAESKVAQNTPEKASQKGFQILLSEFNLLTDTILQRSMQARYILQEAFALRLSNLYVICKNSNLFNNSKTYYVPPEIALMIQSNLKPGDIKTSSPNR